MYNEPSNFVALVGNGQNILQPAIVGDNGRRENGSVAKIKDFVEKTVPLYSLDDFR